MHSSEDHEGFSIPDRPSPLAYHLLSTLNWVVPTLRFTAKTLIVGVSLSFVILALRAVLLVGECS